jgi:hypothetical protein
MDRKLGAAALGWSERGSERKNHSLPGIESPLSIVLASQFTDSNENEMVWEMSFPTSESIQSRQLSWFVVSHK